MKRNGTACHLLTGKRGHLVLLYQRRMLMAGGLAMVLSGGGAKGAFQVGVMDALIRERGVKFDIFAGVSTGAIQALGGAMNDIPGLVNEWTSIRGNNDIYKKRPLGLAGALIGADSLFDAKAIREKIKAYADPAKIKAAKRQLRISAVNLQSGAVQDFGEKNADIGDWVYASCAQPPFFQPFKKKNAAGETEQWVDGGVRNVTPLSSAMELKPKALLVVLASPIGVEAKPGKNFDDLIEVALRSVGILTSEVSANDIGNAMLINDLIAAREAQFRRLTSLGLSATQIAFAIAPFDEQLSRYSFAPIRIIAPDPGFEPSDTMEFKPAKISAAIDHGRAMVAAQWPSLKLFLGA
jgi:NTE family protein